MRRVQNHGGGYSYRLCPLGSEKLDEDCFNKVGLKMTGQSKLRWGGVGGRELPFDAVDVTEGTKAGVMWRRNPDLLSSFKIDLHGLFHFL